MRTPCRWQAESRVARIRSRGTSHAVAVLRPRRSPPWPIRSQQWQPTTLVAALAMVMVLADVAVGRAPQVRVSLGLMVQTTMMALLGPAPAVVIGVLSISLVTE